MESIYATEELDLFREQIRRFLVEEVEPFGEQWEEEGMVPREVLRKMGALGFFGLTYSEKYGGADLDTIATSVLAEELGRCTFGGFTITALVHTDMGSPHLANAGNAAQLAKYMPRIATGELITAIAVTEPDAGSDVAGLRMRAVREGDVYILNGTKMFITNGIHGDLFFVAARTDPNAKGSRGISMFLVEKGTPGFRAGRALKKQGWLCSDTAELIFEDCRIPVENLLGEENKGFYAIMKNFQNERIVLGGMSIGACDRALELTLDYVTTRKAFGGALFDLQTIRQKLAELAGKIEAGRQLVYHAAWLDAQGRDCIKEVSMVKAFCGELANEVLYACQQFHGGAGYLRETPIERMVRDVRILSIGGGATEVMLEEVAKRMTTS